MSRLERLCAEAQRLFDPKMGVLHQSAEFYRAYDRAREAYKAERLFEETATERVDEFSHPNNQADGVYE